MAKKKSKPKNILKVYKAGNKLGINYDLWIAGIKQSIYRKQYITSVTIVETVEGSDSATIKISDPDYYFINSGMYEENRKVKIGIGWTGYTYKVRFNGYISAIDLNFSDSGIPEVTITCMDNTYRMNRKKYSKTYKKKTSAEVVKAKVKKYGFKCVIQSGYKFPKQDSISQSNQTDIEFITNLAKNEVHPFTARLVGNTFYYVKMGKLSDKSFYGLHYKEYPYDLISASFSINTDTKDISVGTTNKKKKKSGIASTKKSSSTKINPTSFTKSTKSTKSSGNSQPKGKSYNSPKKQPKSAYKLNHTTGRFEKK